MSWMMFCTGVKPLRPKREASYLTVTEHVKPGKLSAVPDRAGREFAIQMLNRTFLRVKVSRTKAKLKRWLKEEISMEPIGHYI